MPDKWNAQPLRALAMNPITRDVVCERVVLRQEGIAEHASEWPCTNVPRTVIHHSPDGFEWGCSGSGPADLALNILNFFVPPCADRRMPAPTWGGFCSNFAWHHHQAFKREFIARMPREGGVIPGSTILAWIANRLTLPDHPTNDAEEAGVDLGRPGTGYPEPQRW